ncbi:heat shock protein Hsp15 [Plasticicumulans lactativorans]|uniref:Heat shock protein 15 n=1 Tax=Plasticicumulans lactativorans TaxID=1133106 RepID=A0A4R2L1H8_9GAMM|nr:S4 domain-containing protein [Plasticicumulans lactativorans]TCO80294.1 heat shock protein Hsp15 [Plasticicumulans lactativorans]
MKPAPDTSAEARVRLDRWLWTARFFKTRSLATEAVEGGRVHLNGERTKPAKGVKPGDRLEISRDQQHFEITIRALAEQRGPAIAARQLYEESAASVERREREAQERRLLAAGSPRPVVRPDKKARRSIIRFTRGDA